jgi:hypothetical protein
MDSPTPAILNNHPRATRDAYPALSNQHPGRE